MVKVFPPLDFETYNDAMDYAMGLLYNKYQSIHKFSFNKLKDDDYELIMDNKTYPFIMSLYKHNIEQQIKLLFN